MARKPRLKTAATTRTLAARTTTARSGRSSNARWIAVMPTGESCRNGRRRSSGGQRARFEHVAIHAQVLARHHEVREEALRMGPTRAWVARLNLLGGGDDLVHRVAQGPDRGRDKLGQRAAPRAQHGR